MGYVVEWISEKEKRSYTVFGHREITPSYWVINKEKNIKLFQAWTGIDEPHEVYFVFLFRDKVWEIILTKKFLDENTIIWKEYQALVLPNEVLEEFREAIRAYKLTGCPFLNEEGLKVVVGF